MQNKLLELSSIQKQTPKLGPYFELSLYKIYSVCSKLSSGRGPHFFPMYPYIMCTEWIFNS